MSMISATGSCRKDAGKSSDSAGKQWKSLEHGSSIPNGHCPVDSCQLPLLSGRNRPEIIGKNTENFRPEYYFHKMTENIGNRQFPGQFVRPGV
jgi:hypothetical protein